MTCEEAKQLFADTYYRELDGAARTEFDSHLATCVPCAAEYSELERTLSLMTQREPVEPPPGLSSRLHAQLTANIAAEKRPARARVFSFGEFSRHAAWAYAAAAIVLIGVGIYLGRSVLQPLRHEAGHEVAGHISTAGTDTLSAEAARKDVDIYLDRSKRLLLGLINSPDEDPSPENFAKQQQVSRELIEQASFIESRLQEPDRERFKQLVGDLGIILRELANYSRENGVPLIEMVRQGVDTKSILLKINLEQIRSLDGKMKPHESVKTPDHKSKI